MMTSASRERERLWTHTHHSHHYHGYAYPAHYGASPHAYHNHYRHHHPHPSPSPRSHFFAPHPQSSYHHSHHPNYHHTHSHHYHTHHPHSHPHSYNPSIYRRSSCYEQSSREQRKRKIRSHNHNHNTNRGRKDFIIQVDRSISPALSDITASPTPSMDMSDDNMHVDVHVQQYQSILQPLLECQKTSNVGVSVGVGVSLNVNVKDLRVDTNITMNHDEIEVETPRVERMSEMSSNKKQTSFNWDTHTHTDMDRIMKEDDDNVRTVSPLKSGQKSSDEEDNHDRDAPTPMTTRTANSDSCGAQHQLVVDHEKNASVWREKGMNMNEHEHPNDNPLDGSSSSLRYLISNNVSQSSSELCEAI